MKTFVNTPNQGTLNMRAEPSSAAKVLAQIPNGTQLEVQATTETWSEVTYNGNKGYVMNKYLGENKNISKTNDVARPLLFNFIYNTSIIIISNYFIKVI